MFEGGRYAVGVSVVPVDHAPLRWELEDPDPAAGWAEPLSAWLPARRSAAEAAALLRQIVAAEAKLAALRAELVMDMTAARRTAEQSSPGRERAGETRPPDASEFVPR